MDARKIQKTVTALTALGVKPGKDVQEAITRAQLKVNLPNDTVAALDAVERAETQSALDESVAAYANARAIEMVGRDPGFLATVNERRNRVAFNAVHGYLLDSIPQVCDYFNEHAPAFESALNEVPEGAASGSVLDMSPTLVAAIQRAKETAAPLLSALSAYNEVMGLLGIEEPRPRTGPGASLLVARIGTDFPGDEDEALWSAVNDVNQWAHGANVELAPLYPLVPVVRHGGRLNLVEPGEAQDRMTEFPDARRATLNI